MAARTPFIFLEWTDKMSIVKEWDTVRDAAVEAKGRYVGFIVVSDLTRPPIKERGRFYAYWHPPFVPIREATGNKNIYLSPLDADAQFATEFYQNVHSFQQHLEMPNNWLFIESILPKTLPCNINSHDAFVIDPQRKLLEKATLPSASPKEQFAHIKHLMGVPDDQWPRKVQDMFPGIFKDVATCLVVATTESDDHSWVVRWHNTTYGPFYGKAVLTAHRGDYYGAPHTVDVQTLSVCLRFHKARTQEPAAKKAKCQ